MHQGLLLAKQLNYHNIICFTDSQYCVDILQVPTSKFHTYANLIKDNENHLYQDWQVRIAHTIQ